MNRQRRLIRVYLIGYAPKYWDMRVASESGDLERIMSGTDACVRIGRGENWPVGEVRVMDRDYTPQMRGSMEAGVPYRCVAAEHDGKVVLVERVTEEDN